MPAVCCEDCDDEPEQGPQPARSAVRRAWGKGARAAIGSLGERGWHGGALACGGGAALRTPWAGGVRGIVGQAPGDLDIDSWHGVDVFGLERDCRQPLTRTFMTIWKQKGLSLACDETEENMRNLMLSIEGAYRRNPYHNRIHAAEVTLTTSYFWSRMFPQGGGVHGSATDMGVLILAAAIHDVAHPALNNDFLVKTGHRLAKEYGDESVLENFHLATAFRIMQEAGVALLGHLPSSAAAPGGRGAALRARLAGLVLATDMAHHSSVVGDLGHQCDSRPVLGRFVLHLADMGHALRPFGQHREWSMRVTEEFFAQGDLEASLGLQPAPLYDRSRAPPVPQAQLGFLRAVFVPTWQALGRHLGWTPEAPDKCLQANLAAWQALHQQAPLGAGDGSGPPREEVKIANEPPLH